MSKTDEIIKTIEEHGSNGRGRKELLRHLHGEELTLNGILLAKCFDCMGYYADGRIDCRIEDCPNYQRMPYREIKMVRKNKRAMTEEQKEATKARFKSYREKSGKAPS